MEVATARVVIVVGAFAWQWFLGRKGDPPASPIERVIAGRKRLLAFTPHFSPNPKGFQKLPKRYSPSDMALLIGAVRGESAADGLDRP